MGSVPVCAHLSISIAHFDIQVGAFDLQSLHESAVVVCVQRGIALEFHCAASEVRRTRAATHVRRVSPRYGRLRALRPPFAEPKSSLIKHAAVYSTALLHTPRRAHHAPARRWCVHHSYNSLHLQREASHHLALSRVARLCQPRSTSRPPDPLRSTLRRRCRRRTALSIKAQRSGTSPKPNDPQSTVQ